MPWIGLVAAVGLQYIKGRFLSPKSPKPETDTAPPTLSERGSYVPLVLGRRRVGPVIGWVGKRRTKQEQVGGGGKKGGGKSGGSAEQTVYYEEAWHLLCLGPACALRSVYVSDGSGGVDPLGNASHPSGTDVSADDHDLTIYWGESDQPINTTLGDDERIGISSRWPGICYVHWNDRKLGLTPRWPNIEYEIEVHVDPAFGGSPAWLDGGGTATIGGDDYSVATDNVGVNPAHALWHLLTAPPPWGCGADPATLDLDAFQALGVACADRHLAINLVAADGTAAVEMVASVLEDCGIAFPEVEGRISPRLLVPESTVPTLPSSLTSSTPTERTIAASQAAVARAVYSFENIANAFAEQDRVAEADAYPDAAGGRRTEQRIPLATVCHHQVAAQVIERRQREALAGATGVRLEAARGAAYLAAGDVFALPSGEVLRVLATEYDPDRGVVVIDAVADPYRVEGLSDADDPTFADDPADTAPAVDPTAEWLETPRELSVGLAGLAVIVARVPAHSYILGAIVHLSDDDASYADIGRATGNAFGGQLCETLPRSWDNVTAGPRFLVTGGDADGVLDLTGASSRFESGEQLVIIGREILFVDGVTAISETVYQLGALRRGRYGTTPKAHAVGESAIIIPLASLVSNVSPLLSVGSTYYLKPQPYTAAGAVDLTSVSPIDHRYDGHQRAPLPAHDGALQAAFTTGNDATVEWTATTTGELGEVPIERFEVDLVALGTLAVADTLTITSPSAGANTRTITNAEMVAAFGSEPSAFWAYIYATDEAGTYRSDMEPVLVYRDDHLHGHDYHPVIRSEVFGGLTELQDDLLIHQTFNA
jgi:hypothetical protein